MKTILNPLLKPIAVVCATLLFIAIFKFSIPFYMPLRYIIFIGAIVFILHFYKEYFKLLTFCLIAVLFNPIYPIYLYVKLYWIPIDIIAGILFLLAGFYKELERQEKKKANTLKTSKSYERDKIY